MKLLTILYEDFKVPLKLKSSQRSLPHETKQKINL